jgi:acetyltransferase-like isoleucine patch superfamily enzyme
MSAARMLRRIAMPAWAVSLVCLWKFSARVSPRSEVELTANLRLGRGCVIGSYTKIKTAGGRLDVGEDVAIGNHCFISAHEGGVSIGADTMIGPGACIVGNNYRYDRLYVPISRQATTSKGIVIGEGVWIAAGAVVLDGSEIGDGVIVTPNSVVGGRVPANTIVQGNPAEKIFVRR